MVIAGITLRRQWNRKTGFVALATVAGYVGFYILITPAMWSGPMEQLQITLQSASSFSRWNNMIVFRGAEFPNPGGATPLPVYYIPYMMLTTIPLYTSLLAVVCIGGILFFCLRTRLTWIREKRSLLLLTAALIVFVPILYAVVMRPMVYNGWRHFYFVYAGLVVLAGYGLHIVCQWLQNRLLLRRAFAVLIAACLLFTGTGIIRNHPYEFAYFNALVPRDREHYMELDYWNVGFAGAFRQLYELKQDTEGPLRVGCYFNDISIGAFKLPESIRSRLIITTERDAPYLCYNSTYAYIYRVQEPPEGYHVLFTADSYGHTIITMYERDGAA